MPAWEIPCTNGDAKRKPLFRMQPIIFTLPIILLTNAWFTLATVFDVLLP
jgi:hypothetical protein